MDYIDWIISSFVFLLMVGLVLLTVSKNLPLGDNNFSNAQSIYKSVVENVEIYNIFKKEEEITPYSFVPQDIMGKGQNLFLVEDGVYYGVLKEKDKFILFSEKDSYYWKDVPLEIALEETQKLRLDITDIETMALWLDASVLEDELEDGEAVKTWYDKSGYERDANAYDVNKPLYKINAINGHPVLKFDGTNQKLKTTSLKLTDNSYTIITVLKNEKIDNISGFWAFLPYTHGIYFGSAKWWRGSGYGGCGVAINNAPNNVFLINSVVLYGGINLQDENFDIKIYNNTIDSKGNDGVSTESFQTSNNVGLRIGNWSETSIQYSFGGELAEIIVFNNPLSSEERLLVENYLSQKYAIEVENGAVFFDNHVDIYNEITNQKETTVYFLDKETKEPVGCNYTYKNKKIFIESCEAEEVIATSNYRFQELNNAFVNDEQSLGILIKEENFNDFDFSKTFNIVPDTNVNTGILELKDPSTLTTLEKYYDYYGFLSTNNFLNVYVSYTDENNNYFCRFGDSSIVIGKTQEQTETILKTTNYAKTSDWHKIYFGYTNDNIIICEAGDVKSSYQEETNIPKTNIVVASVYNNTLIDDFFIFLNNDIKINIEQQNIKGNYIDCNVTDNIATINLLDEDVLTTLDVNFSKNLIVPDNNGITLIKNTEEKNKIAMFPQTKEFWLFKEKEEEINIGIDENTEYSIDISGIEDLKLWLDASTLNLNDGELVSVWEDKSENGFDGTQTVTESKPTFKTNILNGKPVVRFNNSALTTPNVTFQDWHIFVVFNDVSTVTSYERILDHSYINGFWLGRNDSSANSWRSGVKEGSPYGRFITIPDGEWNIIQNIRENTTHTITAGNETISGSVTNTETSLYPIGIGSWASQQIEQRATNMDIAEIIMYDKALSNVDKILVENYLSQKYAIDVENGIDKNATSISLMDSVSFKEKIKIEFVNKETEKPISCNYSFKNKKVSLKSCDANAIVKIKYNFDEEKTIPETKKITTIKTTQEAFFKNKIETLTEQSYYLRLYNKTLNLENKDTRTSSNNYKNFTKLLWSNGFLEEVNIEIKE